jgi:diguanylate cyclase (GGDEF)-like protein
VGSVSSLINKFDRTSYVVTFSDITAGMDERLRLADQVTHDELTHASNRTYFEQTIQRTIDLSADEGKTTGIIFFDIDHFKTVNDEYGHDVGDDVLKTVVDLVSNHTRRSDKLIL